MRLSPRNIGSLVAGLESLVNQTENWRKELSSLRHAESARSTATESEDSYHDMLANGFYHV